MRGLFVLSCLLLMVGANAAEVPLAYRAGGPLAGMPGYDYQQQTEALYPGAVECFSPHRWAFPLFDKQSLLKKWTAPDLPMRKPKAAEQIHVSPVRPYRGPGPFSVIRCQKRDPVFTLDCGELPVGLYAVRVIATVDKANLRPFREPIYIGMKINDGLKAAANTYRIRIGYADDFFSVAEIYFHAPEQREYQAELWVDQGSTIDLLVHTLTLDDALAGAKSSAFKAQRTLHTDGDIRTLKESYNPDEKAAVGGIPSLTPEERLARDEMLWNWFPPLNAQGSMLDGEFRVPDVREGAGGKTKEAIETEYGKWVSPGGVGHQVDHNLGFSVGYDRSLYGVFLANQKLGLNYTLADLAAHKPLPDPYPFKDDGAGLFLPDPAYPGKGEAFAPIAQAVHSRLRQASGGWDGAARLWIKSGNENLGRDAAVQLVRYAYQFPTIETPNFLISVVRQPGWLNLDFRCYNRFIKQEWMFSYDSYLSALKSYDLTFDYIKGNQPLADSLHRFVPSIKTPEDVIALLDTYLVQHTAKRTLRYHDHTWPGAIARIAATVGNPELADEWVREYANGLKATILKDTDREGCKALGSSSYSHDEGASQIAAMIDTYIQAGGGADLSVITKTPRPTYQCDWALSIMVGGWDWLRIGDVTGPGAWFSRTKPWLTEAAVRGWRWEKDPRFAWILKNGQGRKSETDVEWQEIETAAALVRRAPWLDNRSRAIDNWAGILETGRQHDDPRFRRAVYVRTGTGSGHAHSDAMDLHLLAHGLHAMMEGGQRSGYSKPNDKFLRVHNTVEVLGSKPSNEFGDSKYAYTRTLVDAAGAPYLEAVAVPPANATLYRRQVALVDVDEGTGSRPFSISEQLPGATLPSGVKSANSYLLDVFRVSGGGLHTYCFHGTVNDEFNWNVSDPKPVAHVKPVADWKSEADYLSIFEWTPDSKAAGDAPETLEATWRMVRFEKDTRGGTSEEAILGKTFEPESPRRYTKLHLLGAKGLRALKADVLQTKCAEDENLKNPGKPPAGYRWTCLYARTTAADERLESAFVGVVEPYLGEPFIASTRLLPVVGNEADAHRAVAVEVKLKDDRIDQVFADGRPDKIRQAGGCRVSGEYAFHSTDAQGFRQATLIRGTLLETREMKLALLQPEWTAKIAQTDHANQSVLLDGTWPPLPKGTVVEVLHSDRATSYTLAASPSPEGAASRLRFTRDTLLSMDTPTGQPRYAIAAGDVVRAPSFVNVRRISPGSFEVTGNGDAEVAIKGQPARKITAAEFAAPDAVIWIGPPVPAQPLHIKTKVFETNALHPGVLQ